MIARWLLYSIADLLSCAIALVISPITSFFVDSNGNMRILSWWLQTPDSNMFGVTGDSGFAEKHKAKLSSYFGRVLVCFLWQWRNTAQGFSQNVLGVNSDGLRITSTSNRLSEKYENEIVVAVSNFKVFQVKGSYYLSDSKRVRWNIGWKLNMRDRQSKCMIVVSFSPFVNR